MRIGILGAAAIAPKGIIDPAKELPGVEIVAVAASDRERAETFARAHGIPKAYGRYEELVSDTSIDAIYNALINSLHAEWSTAAVEAGQHVLCEKPLAANAQQAGTMVAAADRADRLLVEAFHWRFHPLGERVVELSQRIGRLRDATGRLDANIPPGGNRYQFDLAGGALMDLGCYVVHWLRTVAGEEPTVVSAQAAEGPPDVDVSVQAELAFPSGFTAHVSCAMDQPGAKLPSSARLHVTGSEGWVDVINPVAPQLGNRVRARLADGTEVDESFEGRTSYWHQLDAFVKAVSGEIAPITGGTDAIGNMATIDAIYLAAGLPLRD
jgi:predicted dehydrogenase